MVCKVKSSYLNTKLSYICQLHTTTFKTALTGSKHATDYEKKNLESLFLNWLLDLMNKLIIFKHPINI